jgi:hypothetical protein
MEIKNIKVLLDKLNGLYQVVSKNEDGIQQIERDLMLSYLRQLYEQVAAVQPKQPHQNNSCSRTTQKNYAPYAPPHPPHK